MVDISITIPIYNEEGSIARTVENHVRAFEENKVDFELVLVNHGSWDNTEKILEGLGKKFGKKLNIINLEKNRGYGGGIQYGMDHSTGRYIGWTCADEEVSAEDAYKIYKVLKESDADVAKAQRMQRTDGIFRKFTSFVFNTLVRLRFGLYLKDINGFPLYMKKELYADIKARETAHLFNLDLLRNMRKHNYKIIEVPSIHRKRIEGKTFMKLSRIFEMAFDLLKYSF